jgi:hypothetical protein
MTLNVARHRLTPGGASRFYIIVFARNQRSSYRNGLRTAYMIDTDTERLQKILQGAFSGPPTPLKEIPTRKGKQRTKRKPQPPRPRRQRKSRAA